MRVLLVHSGVDWSPIETGLFHGLLNHGADVFLCHPDDALLSTVTRDAVIVVTPRRLDVLEHLKRAGDCVAAYLTETPYEMELELEVSRCVDLVWTSERTGVEAFRAVNPHASYLPHGWMVHPDQPMPAHDVVFVGSGFPERIDFFNAIDWSGIDLGLYGTWRGFGLKPDLEADAVMGDQIDNATAAALYRRCKVGLNLYRTRTSDRIRITTAESLNPRAYELAALGVFHVSAHRKEVHEVFQGHVPTFQTPEQAEVLIRSSLAVAPSERDSVAKYLPLCVQGMSWTDRAAQVLADLAKVAA